MTAFGARRRGRGIDAPTAGGAERAETERPSAATIVALGRSVLGS